MNRVKELRQRAGMSQKELAITVGVSCPTISEWEHQKKDPTAERLRNLAEAFDVNTGVILGFEEIPSPVPILFVADGSDTKEKQIANARRLVQRGPERASLFTMASTADIKDVRRAIAVLEALKKVDT